jgi:hypothetical protein
MPYAIHFCAGPWRRDMARKVNGRTAFLPLKDRIEADLAAGHFAKNVHAKYETQLGFSYRQFLYYVREYRLSSGAARPADTGLAVPAPPENPGARGPSRSGGPVVPDVPAPRKFVFRPADIDAKKLI